MNEETKERRWRFERGALLAIEAVVMGGTSEHEFLEKIVKIKEKASKMANNVRDDFAKMEKLKGESLKKVDEMRRSTEVDFERLEQEAAKSKGLVPESRERINEETREALNQIQEKYSDLKRRITDSIVPT